ncbi:MAG TPA: tRNA uridine-5-carboxymethylaminomethyl(34) synthesis GTPase MnmE, partial [Rubricoccaceae bacterium]
LAGLARERPDLPVLLVANKADLVGVAPGPGLAGALAVSARDALARPDRLDPLRDALLVALRADAAGPEADGVAVNERHRRHLADAQAAVHRAQAALAAGTGPGSPDDADLLALDLRDALHALGLVTGAVTADDVLAAVFSRFCIGK